MALRIPGKGNFKPVRPLKPVPKRPPVPSSLPTTKPARPTVVTAASQPDPDRDTEANTSTTKTTTVTSVTASTTVVAASVPAVASVPQVFSVPEVAATPAVPAVAPAPVPTVEALPPAIPAVPPTVAAAPSPEAPKVQKRPATSTSPEARRLPPPRLLPSALPSESSADDERRRREDSVASDAWPPTPSAASPASATTPRGPRRAKPLLAAAAASKTPTQRGTLREREKIKQKERAEREKEKLEHASRRFTPAHSPAPSTPMTPVAAHDATRSPTTLKPGAGASAFSGLPPSVASSFPPSVASTSDLPPSVLMSSTSMSVSMTSVAMASDLPPMVAPAVPDDSTTAQDTLDGTPDPAELTAALNASIAPKKSSAATFRKRPVRRMDTPDTTESTPATSPKRRRTIRQGTVDTEADDADGNTSDAQSESSTKRGVGRALRGRYGTRGRAGTSNDRRTTAYKRQTMVAAANLDGVEVNDMVGQEVNATVTRMGDLATSLAAQGRVSARGLKLANFQKNEDERKVRERAERAERNWRRRQIVRRKARELRNNQRADRREAARARGDDPDAVSADEVDSEEEYEVEPDRLTPPGSPVQKERIAPVRFEPEPEAAAEEGAEGGAGPSGNADVEDIEGLGFHQQSELPEEEGETLEDFQLPVEDDPAEESGAAPDFSGLEYNDYTGGYLDDEGNWVEGGNHQAAFLQQRNEERRKRLMEGDHGQAVELIDNDTQFVNSATWGKKVNNDRWTSEETELFFAVLRETGENYTLMKAYFPGRTVRQLKNKGSRENRANPQRMTDAILNRKPMDKQYLAKSAGFNIDRPYDRENAFFEEVAREKERVIAGLLPEVGGEEMEMHDELEVQSVQAAWEASSNIEFVRA